MGEKKWGDEEFWGIGEEWDPDWLLTERQRELRDKLIGLCESELRQNAKRSDDELLYPRRNFEILAENGFLGNVMSPRNSSIPILSAQRVKASLRTAPACIS
jgi:hypothetical protein